MLKSLELSDRVEFWKFQWLTNKHICFCHNRVIFYPQSPALRGFQGFQTKNTASNQRQRCDENVTKMTTMTMEGNFEITSGGSNQNELGRERKVCLLPREKKHFPAENIHHLHIHQQSLRSCNISFRRPYWGEFWKIPLNVQLRKKFYVDSVQGEIVMKKQLDCNLKLKQAIVLCEDLYRLARFIFGRKNSCFVRLTRRATGQPLL